MSRDDLRILPGDALLTHGSIVLLYEVSAQPQRGGGYDFASMLQCAHDDESFERLGPHVRHGTQGSSIIERSAVRWLWRSRP